MNIFHKPSKKDNIPSVLPKLNICNNEFLGVIKFLGVFLYEINSQQKHAIKIIYKKKYDTVRKLMISRKILNVYQVNILNNTMD